MIIILLYIYFPAQSSVSQGLHSKNLFILAADIKTNAKHFGLLPLISVTLLYNSRKFYKIQWKQQHIMQNMPFTHTAPKKSSIQ